MSKVYFYGYGYRDTKSWSCPYCKMFAAGGMDLSVDESVNKHLLECPGLAKSDQGKCTVCGGGLTARQVVGLTAHRCNNGWVFINHSFKPTPVPEPVGYHTREIARGKFGEVSKIREELEELEDAEKQGVRIMVMVELGDLYGAIRGFAASRRSRASR